MSDPVSEHPNTEKNIWESPAERQNRELQAEVERLTTLLKHTVPRLITVLRMPNIEHVADAHNEAVVTLRAALAGEGDTPCT